MAEYNLQVEKREILGSRVKTLRREGQVPAVIYGPHLDSKSIKINGREFLDIYKQAGKTHVIDLILDNQKTSCIIQDIEADPVKNILFHVDFLAIKMDEKVLVSVPIKVVGDSKALKEGGVLNIPLSEVEISCLPGKIPESIEVDITSIETVNDSIKLEDLETKDYTFSDLGLVVASVTLPSSTEESETPTTVIGGEEEDSEEKEKTADSN